MANDKEFLDDVSEIKIDLTPDKSLFEKLGKGQHELIDAIAELIDNSFDARTDEQCAEKNQKPLKINITTPMVQGRAGSIEIADDALGMDETTAKECLVIAKTSRKGMDLGRFGLGLKQACLSIGKEFTITTKQEEGKYRYVLVYNNKKFLEESKWTDFILKKIKDNSNWHGTKIKISSFWNPDLITLRKLEGISNRAAFIFGPFIKSGVLDLRINQTPVEAVNLKTKCESISDLDFKLKSKTKKGDPIRVTGWIGILKSGSTIGFSGFNLFRNMRLIKAWEKIGYRYHAEMRLLTGELHLDDFPVAIDKKDFIRDSKQWIELAGEERYDEGVFVGYETKYSALSKEIKKVVGDYKKRTEEGRKEKRILKVQEARKEKEQKLKILEEKKEVIELLKKITTPTTSSEEKNQKKGGLPPIEISKEFKAQLEEEGKSLVKERGELIKQLVLSTFLERKKININNEDYNFDVKPIHLGDVAPWYAYKIKGFSIWVQVNVDYPFIDKLHYSDIDIYFDMITILALAEAIVEIKKENKGLIKKYTNDLLRIYATEIKAKDQDLSKKSNEFLIQKLKEVKTREVKF